jgi:hypothetical protein
LPRAAPSWPLVLAAAIVALLAAPARARLVLDQVLGSTPAGYFKLWGAPYPLVVPAGKPADVVVSVHNDDPKVAATPGTIRLFFTSDPFGALLSFPPGLGICGTTAANVSFAPPPTPIKPKGRAFFTIPNVPIPGPGWGALSMLEPGEARARGPSPRMAAPA